MALRFFYNGIKDSDGKLQKCHYSKGNYHSLPADTLTIYARDYKRFSAEVRDAFVVENNSDSMTDYFEQDRIRVMADHPLYAQVHAALDKCTARYANR